MSSASLLVKEKPVILELAIVLLALALAADRLAALLKPFQKASPKPRFPPTEIKTVRGRNAKRLPRSRPTTK
jgi:hypothetical protein